MHPPPPAHLRVSPLLGGGQAPLQVLLRGLAAHERAVLRVHRLLQRLHAEPKARKASRGGSQGETEELQLPGAGDWKPIGFCS